MATSSIALLALVLPLAALAQPASIDEVQTLRAQIAALTARLDAIEAQAKADEVEKVAVEKQKAADEVAAQSVAPELLRPSSKSAIAVAPGPIGRALQSAGSEFELLASSESSRASIKFTRDVGETRLQGEPEGWASTTRISLSASAPLDKKGTRTDLATLDGFTSDFDVRLGVSQYRRKLRDPTRDARAIAIMEEAIAACKAREGATPEEIEKCSAGPKGGNFVFANLGPIKEREYLQRAFPPGAFAYGVEGRLGYRKYEFIDVANLAMDSSSGTPWGVRAYASYLPRSLMSFTGALEYTEGRKEQKEAVICPAIATTVTCLRGASGRPKDDHKILGSLEYRQLFPLPKAWLIKGVGVAALVSRDFENDSTLVDLPVYFVPDSKGNFLGGVRFGWNSEDHDVTAGVFFTSAFSPRQ